MTSTITESDVKTIESQDLLDAIRPVADNYSWCTDAERYLEARTGIVTYRLGDVPDCGCCSASLEQTEPRFTRVSGPTELTDAEVKTALLAQVRQGGLYREDAARIADKVGVQLFGPRKKFHVELDVTEPEGETWDESGPDSYQLRWALRYDRASNLTVTKVIEGETV